jgi:hypothetical protein
MTRDEAKRLLERLRVAYPRLALPNDTVALWLAELQAVEAEVGAEVVDSLIHSVTFFPSIAEFTTELAMVRERRGQANREEQRRAAIEAEQALAPLSPEVLRQMRDYSARLAGRPELTEVEPGICDDCQAEGLRYRFAALSVCSACGAARAGAAVRLIQGDVTIARRWAHDEGPNFSDDAVARRLEEILPDERFADLRIELADEVADLRRENAA